MKSILFALPAALLLAGAAAAQPQDTDAVKQDGDPVAIGAPANPAAGPDTPAEAATTSPDAKPAAATETPPVAATPQATPTTPTRLYATTPATTDTQVVTNGPVPDTPENRARFGGPNSRAGKLTAARGD